MNLDETLNQQQLDAVLHRDGPCLVLAGAGSGKTRVLTMRVATLIDQGVSPHEIMAITFTNKAANEMKSRIHAMSIDFNGQWIRTFHSASHMILRMEIEQLGYKKDFSILDEGEKRSVVKECLRDLGDTEQKPEPVAFVIEQIKNNLKGPDKYLDQRNLPPQTRDLFERCFRLYQARLKELNALDFEDLIVVLIRLFQEYPEVQRKYQERFRYVMIDEYQDTNYAQFVWANLMAGQNRNLFVVGDPDQSIYSWRGAEPENIKRFLEVYPEAKTIRLEKNYRSTESILEAANNVIINNPGRLKKKLVTDNPQGERLVQFCAADHRQEAEYAARMIYHLVKGKKYDYHDFAIFYRTHFQSRNFEEVFNRNQIPYRIIGGVKFYQRKEVKDILAYLKLAANPADRVSFRRIVNVPRRGVGEATIRRLEDLSTENGVPILEMLAEVKNLKGFSSKVKEELTQFYGMTKYLQSLAATVSLGTLLEETIELTRYVEDLKTNHPLEAEERIENLKELHSLVIDAEREGRKDLSDFLAEVALLQEVDDTDYSNTVSMMTFHSAKGLEFPVVFMTGMEEGLFPSYRAESQSEMEEERRLCYVGITRAMERLFLSRAVYRVMYGAERTNMCSRFLKEIPDELFVPLNEMDKKNNSAVTSKLVNLSAGDVIQHRKYGRGVVISLKEENIAVVDFEQYGTRNLMIDIAPIVKIG
ncbi:MAG: ATP-dependent helicase [Chitinophagales bacterium]